MAHCSRMSWNIFPTTSIQTLFRLMIGTGILIGANGHVNLRNLRTDGGLSGVRFSEYVGMVRLSTCFVPTHGVRERLPIPAITDCSLSIRGHTQCSLTRMRRFPTRQAAF